MYINYDVGEMLGWSPLSTPFPLRDLLLRALLPLHGFLLPLRSTQFLAHSAPFCTPLTCTVMMVSRQSKAFLTYIKFTIAGLCRAVTLSVTFLRVVFYVLFAGTVMRWDKAASQQMSVISSESEVLTSCSTFVCS